MKSLFQLNYVDTRLYFIFLGKFLNCTQLVYENLQNIGFYYNWPSRKNDFSTYSKSSLHVIVLVKNASTGVVLWLNLLLIYGRSQNNLNCGEINFTW